MIPKHKKIFKKININLYILMALEIYFIISARGGSSISTLMAIFLALFIKILYLK